MFVETTAEIGPWFSLEQCLAPTEVGEEEDQVSCKANDGENCHQIPPGLTFKQTFAFFYEMCCQSYKCMGRDHLEGRAGHVVDGEGGLLFPSTFWGEISTLSLP